MRLAVVCAFVIATSFLLTSDPAVAACTCECVNGQAQGYCDTPSEPTPRCDNVRCPGGPDSSPPSGKSKCVNRLVYNPRTDRYEMREVCE